MGTERCAGEHYAETRWAGDGGESGFAKVAACGRG
jgi:hypothetical protein